MKREASRWLALWSLLAWLACGDKPAPTPPAAQEIPASAPPPTAAPTAQPKSAPNPCDTPAPKTLELAAGATAQTPWDLELRYVVDEDKKLGSGYMFQLKSGERRWETRRTNRNWNQPIMWRGFCWRGAERPKPRSLQLKIEIAPVCKAGKLQELGCCGDTFGAS